MDLLALLVSLTNLDKDKPINFRAYFISVRMEEIKSESIVNQSPAIEKS